MSLPTYQEWAEGEGLEMFPLSTATMRDFGAWYLVPVVRTKDSPLLFRVNFDTAIEILKDAGAEYSVRRYHHWTCGYLDILITPDEVTAAAIQARLEDYPVLDDDAFNREEHEAILERWNNLNLGERIVTCAAAGNSIFSARREAPPREVCGTLRDD